MRRGHEHGGALVEFALIMPLLLLLILGIVEFGRAYNAQSVLSDAARAGAREMALHDNVNDAIAATLAAAPTLPISATGVSVSPSTCAGTDQPARVTVEYDMNLAVLGAVTLTGIGTMRCNG